MKKLFLALISFCLFAFLSFTTPTPPNPELSNLSAPPDTAQAIVISTDVVFGTVPVKASDYIYLLTHITPTGTDIYVMAMVTPETAVDPSLIVLPTGYYLSSLKFAVSSSIAVKPGKVLNVVLPNTGGAGVATFLPIGQFW